MIFIQGVIQDRGKCLRMSAVHLQNHYLQLRIAALCGLKFLQNLNWKHTAKHFRPAFRHSHIASDPEDGCKALSPKHP